MDGLLSDVTGCGSDHGSDVLSRVDTQMSREGTPSGVRIEPARFEVKYSSRPLWLMLGVSSTSAVFKFT